MPRYSYRCTSCEKESDFYHSMSEEILDCSLCDAKTSMTRLPSKFSLFKQQKQNKTGDLVNSAIAENQEELKQEKEKLRNIFYESDD
jgi:putative FmdB family regulatory protein